MTDKIDGGVTARRSSLTVRLAAGLGVALLAYLVFRVTAVWLSPPLGLVLPPTDPSGLARGLPFATGDPRSRVSADALALARDVAASSPLAYEPFFVQAKAEEQAGRIDRAILLMEEARRRRPNFELTRIHLVGYYQQARRFPELINELDFVLRRNARAGQIILPELARLIADRQGRMALATILSRNPPWRDEFFEAAKQRRGDAADALDLLNLIQAQRPRGGLAAERGLYLHRLVQAGNHAQARAIWLQSLPEREREQHRMLFNGAFRRIQAAEPFGWTLRQETQGRTEIVRAGGNESYLDIVYYGGSDVLLAYQTLALPAGRYRLSQLASSRQGIRSGSVQWTLTCLTQGGEVARLPFANLTSEYRRNQIEFAIPGNCVGQILRLTAEPGDIAAEVDAQVARLEIARAG